MTEPTTCYIGFGSNLGDRDQYIRQAIEMLAESEGIEVSQVSDLIETAPLAGTEQPLYLNAVAWVNTTLDAQNLHKKISEIETSLGRCRQIKWSPRTIDLDLLLYGDQIINHPNLTVPHPQMHLRTFALKGLCQLNSKLVHPVIKEPVNELAARLNGCDFRFNLDLPRLVSIAGVIGVGKTILTTKLADMLHCMKLLEPYDRNPFMPHVYAGQKEMALDSQLFFLTARAGQLGPDGLHPGTAAISDYIFDKEGIYAQHLLNKEQMTLYRQISHSLAPTVAKPALVIYLRDSVENCLERIHKRNRPYEQKIEPDFLGALDSDYEKLFADWKISPLIRLSVPNDGPAQDSDVEHLASQIKSYIAL